MRKLFLILLLALSCYQLIDWCTYGEVVSVFVKVENYRDANNVPYGGWDCTMVDSCTFGYPVTITSFAIDSSTIAEVDFWEGDVKKVNMQNGGWIHWGILWNHPHDSLDHAPVSITFWADEECTEWSGFGPVQARPLYMYIGRPAHENHKESDCFCLNC